jgi:hypothetical protein
MPLTRGCSMRKCVSSRIEYFRPLTAILLHAGAINEPSITLDQYDQAWMPTQLCVLHRRTCVCAARHIGGKRKC